MGAKVLVDACQSVPHMIVDVQHLDVDFLVASSHKVLLSCVLQFCNWLPLFCLDKVLES